MGSLRVESWLAETAALLANCIGFACDRRPAAFAAACRLAEGAAGVCCERCDLVRRALAPVLRELEI